MIQGTIDPKITLQTILLLVSQLHDMTVNLVFEKNDGGGLQKPKGGSRHKIHHYEERVILL